MTVNPIAFERSFEGPSLDDRSRCLRRLTIHALKGGERGHIGSTMSLIEIMRVLYDDILSFKPELPDWSWPSKLDLGEQRFCYLALLS
mgnify:CR=1 FL=1